MRMEVKRFWQMRKLVELKLTALEPGSEVPQAPFSSYDIKRPLPPAEGAKKRLQEEHLTVT